MTAFDIFFHLSRGHRKAGGSRPPSGADFLTFLASFFFVLNRMLNLNQIQHNFFGFGNLTVSEYNTGSRHI